VPSSSSVRVTSSSVRVTSHLSTVGWTDLNAGVAAHVSLIP
jgi:hypothetical protein